MKRPLIAPAIPATISEPISAGTSGSPASVSFQ